MRIIVAASVVFGLTLASAIGSFDAGLIAASQAPDPDPNDAKRREGQTVFRYDTFGDEQLWTDVLR